MMGGSSLSALLVAAAVAVVVLDPSALAQEGIVDGDAPATTQGATDHQLLNGCFSAMTHLLDLKANMIKTLAAIGGEKKLGEAGAKWNPAQMKVIEHFEGKLHATLNKYSKKNMKKLRAAKLKALRLGSSKDDSPQVVELGKEQSPTRRRLLDDEEEPDDEEYEMVDEQGNQDPPPPKPKPQPVEKPEPKEPPPPESTPPGSAASDGASGADGEAPAEKPGEEAATPAEESTPPAEPEGAAGTQQPGAEAGASSGEAGGDAPAGGPTGDAPPPPANSLAAPGEESTPTAPSPTPPVANDVDGVGAPPPPAPTPDPPMKPGGPVAEPEAAGPQRR